VGLPANANDAVIVRAVIDLGHNLGMHVVAEGVEDACTCTLLSQLDCDIAQGYYISRPLPAAVFTAWLADQSPRLLLRHTNPADLTNPC
jgi:EAL domain-containing protein (putative c-di-GMP-specific phosphodiesterase class I)